jgi:hypothetical protein
MGETNMGWHRKNSVIKVLLLINRNALFLVPLVGGTFLLMAGKIGTSYGTQYLFRDNQLKFDSGWLLLAQSTRVFSALYATALMGLTWTLFVLIEERDEDPSSLHPITDVRSILFPPVLVLSLPMIAAALINQDKHDAHWVVVLLLSLLGLGGGLLVVAGVTGPWTNDLAAPADPSTVDLYRSERGNRRWRFLAAGHNSLKSHFSYFGGLRAHLLPFRLCTRAISHPRGGPHSVSSLSWVFRAELQIQVSGLGALLCDLVSNSAKTFTRTGNSAPS